MSSADLPRICCSGESKGRGGCALDDEAIFLSAPSAMCWLLLSALSMTLNVDEAAGSGVSEGGAKSRMLPADLRRPKGFLKDDLGM
jgi:hypothetical protein